MSHEQRVESEKVTYVQKTDRIQALSQFIKSVMPLIWLAVILIVIIPLLGRLLIAHSVTPNTTKINPSPDSTIVIEPRPDLSQVNQAVESAIKKAHGSAEAFAAKELDAWQEELISRVDNFLDWYFGYFNQKKI